MDAREGLKYFIYSLIILFLQIFVFNNIEFGSGLFVSLPILFILLLPIEMSKWLLLFLAFSFGLTIDIFSDTLALNTAGLVFSAFLRPAVLSLLQPSEGFEPGKKPSVFYFGFSKFLIYASIHTLAFEIVYYLFEIFSFSKFFIIIYKSLIAGIMSVITITIIHILFLRNKK